MTIFFPRASVRDQNGRARRIALGAQLGAASVSPLDSGRGRRRALGESVHELLKVRGRIEKGDGDPVFPDEALVGGNAFAADHGGLQLTSFGFTWNVQSQRELAAWLGVEVRQQQEPPTTRIVRNSAASLLTFELDLRHEVYELAWGEPLVFGFGHSF